jgi:hypothetical protein
MPNETPADFACRPPIWRVEISDILQSRGHERLYPILKGQTEHWMQLQLPVSFQFHMPSLFSRVSDFHYNTPQSEMTMKASNGCSAFVSVLRTSSSPFLLGRG